MFAEKHISKEYMRKILVTWGTIPPYTLPEFKFQCVQLFKHYGVTLLWINIKITYRNVICFIKNSVPGAVQMQNQEFGTLIKGWAAFHLQSRTVCYEDNLSTCSTITDSSQYRLFFFCNLTDDHKWNGLAFQFKLQKSFYWKVIGKKSERPQAMEGWTESVNNFFLLWKVRKCVKSLKEGHVVYTSVTCSTSPQSVVQCISSCLTRSLQLH